MLSYHFIQNLLNFTVSKLKKISWILFQRMIASFISTKNEFHVSGHTIATNGRLVIVSGKDTMDIELETHNIDLGTFKIENGHFKLPYWANKKEYSCTNHQDDCKLIKKVNSYKKSDRPEYKNLDKFSQVEIKLSR